MTKFIKYCLIFWLVEVFVLKNLVLFNKYTPNVLPLLMMLFPFGYGVLRILFISFFIVGVVDLFFPGRIAFSSVILVLALIRNFLISLIVPVEKYLPRDTPNPMVIGYSKFVSLLGIFNFLFAFISGIIDVATINYFHLFFISIIIQAIIDFIFSISLFFLAFKSTR